jgi:hypothetical protein
MDRKRKISAIKILQLVVTVVVVTACVVAITASSNVQVDKKVKGVKINITNARYHFIDEQQVKDILLNDRHININALSINKIDLNKMERIIISNPWVERAQVYIDNKRVMHVNVSQRVPVARLFETDGNSYYLDETLKTMPLSDKYSHYATVVTNVPSLQNDSLGTSIKAQIVAMVKHIDKDTFWRAQVSQLIWAGVDNFEIEPVLGNQRILIGDTSRLDEKFNNLFAFYKKVLNRIGWDKYEMLDVRYAGQVVASPALAWNKPKDNSMSNLNWVKTIIGEDKVTESDTPTIRMVTPVTIATPGITSVNKQVVIPTTQATATTIVTNTTQQQKTNNNKEKAKTNHH